MSDERETYRGLLEDLRANDKALSAYADVTIHGRAADAIIVLCDEIDRLKARHDELFEYAVDLQQILVYAGRERAVPSRAESAKAVREGLARRGSAP